MTMKRSLAAVRDTFDELQNAVREFAVAVDDCPRGHESLAVIEALRAHATEVEGDLRETAAVAVAACDAEEAGEAARVARLLADAHERFSAAARRIRFGLSGHGSLFEIERLGGRRGPAWRSWSDIVLRQIELIDDALHRADTALVGCWQEVVDRTTAGVSVTASGRIEVHPVKRTDSAAM